MRIHPIPDGFELYLEDCLILRHTTACPALSIGLGLARMAMYRGNFDISDDLVQRRELGAAVIDGETIRFDGVDLLVEGDQLRVEAPEGLNRLWLRLHAEASEAVWGCGEQMSYLNLRGRRFPIWTSEPGVGRDKTTAITRQADDEGRAGGDYYTTNAPQPTYLTSRRLAVHADTTAYCVFDFSGTETYELEFWSIPARIEFFHAPDLLGLVQILAARFGHAPRLPDWAMAGAIIGLKDGASSFDRLETFLEAGCAVSALWCEDWVGIRQTSFGTRLFWDWVWSPARHPDLPARIAALAERGIRFMGYASCYLCTDGTLYPEAEALGLLARNRQGGPYQVDFGEFTAGIPDFTLRSARDWFAERILRHNMLDLGLSGWMADFGEYLPVDAVLAHGDAMDLHNDWPRLWAGVNADATADRPDAMFFMRAAGTGSQRHNRLLWAGDQCVDFSRHDGIGTAITGALSAGLVGHAFHHSDIGGYTSLFGLVRTPELIMRWTELACFTPVMRTHEGNRPRDNLQIDEDRAVLAHFARFTQLHARLLPLFHSLADEAARTGLPVQRPLFLHHPDDRATWDIQDQWLLGPDVLVAPVIEAAATARAVYLPAGEWVHGWSGRILSSGWHNIPAPIGKPPVFWRNGSQALPLL
jgi:alpha-glucosidase